MVLELKNLTINELQRNYEIVQIYSIQNNEDSGVYQIANEKIIFMYDGYEIAEYTNSSYLNEDVSNTKNLLLSSEIPICKEYTSCQYKEMEICFNDITIKEKIVSDNWVQATIINKENSIKNIKFSEDGGKNRKIERFKQTIDNIESLVQYCKNSLNSKDIARLG